VLSPKRRVRWGMLGVVCTLALSGASRPKQVAAHTKAPAAPRAETSASSVDTSDPTAAGATPPPAVTRAEMRAIPAGDYLPFYKGKAQRQGISVPAFAITAEPVKQEDFLAFARRNPRWRRSRVERLFAEASYLSDWSGDSDLGDVPPGSAVTKVSWFAAKAYCASLGQRLPTTVEWERALSVLGSSFAATGGSTNTNLAASLWEWTGDFNSVPVAEGDPSESVTNLFCGAGARATDATDYGAFLRYSFRSSLKADFALKNLGFRCAQGGS
jgi:formylglycine-generating enzyme